MGLDLETRWQEPLCRAERGRIRVSVKAALAEVAKPHAEGQPKQTVEVPVAINQPYVPPTIEKAVKKQTNGWGWSSIDLGGAGAAIAGWPWQTIALFAGLLVAA